MESRKAIHKCFGAKSAGPKYKCLLMSFAIFGIGNRPGKWKSETTKQVDRAKQKDVPHGGIGRKRPLSWKITPCLFWMAMPVSYRCFPINTCSDTSPYHQYLPVKWVNMCKHPICLRLLPPRLQNARNHPSQPGRTPHRQLAPLHGPAELRQRHDSHRARSVHIPLDPPQQLLPSLRPLHRHQALGCQGWEALVRVHQHGAGGTIHGHGGAQPAGYRRGPQQGQKQHQPPETAGGALHGVQWGKIFGMTCWGDGVRMMSWSPALGMYWAWVHEL